jgi:hypothetical protein
MSDPKSCDKCGRVGHRKNKCKWPPWRTARPELSREQKRAGVGNIVSEIKVDKWGKR